MLSSIETSHRGTLQTELLYICRYSVLENNVLRHMTGFVILVGKISASQERCMANTAWHGGGAGKEKRGVGDGLIEQKHVKLYISL